MQNLIQKFQNFFTYYKDDCSLLSKEQKLKYASQMGILALLNWHLIEKILFYCCDLDELEKNKKICRLSRGLIQPRIKQITRQNDIPLNGRQYMDDLYLALDLPNDVIHIYGIKVEVYTKDQGWATVNYSCSLVELRILDDKKKCIDQVIIATNFKQEEYQRVNKRFDSKDNREFLSKVIAAQQIVLHAISYEPCWDTYIKSARLVLFYE